MTHCPPYNLDRTTIMPTTRTDEALYLFTGWSITKSEKKDGGEKEDEGRY